VRASGVVNENAKKVLQEKGIWSEEYHSKTLEEVLHVDYDLVVTVCDHAKETCPMFPKAIKTLHVSFEDPDGKGIEAFYETYEQIRTKLLSKITEVLS
jgi:arsenate reductase